MNATATTLSAEVAECDRGPVLRGQGEVGRPSDGGQPLLMAGAMRLDQRRPSEQRQTQAKRCQPYHPFSSRFSSLRKRQSVPSAMICCGVDLIRPASCSRSEKNLQRVLRVEVSPFKIRNLIDCLKSIIIVLGVTAFDQPARHHIGLGGA